MVTIKDIAKQCNVAVSTVSRVLNHHPNVSERTRQKVEEACASLHYVPNTSARNLVLTSSNTIALVLRGFNNPFFGPIIRSIEQEIASSGYSLELHQISDEGDELLAGEMVCASRHLKGVLFLGGHLNYSPKDLENLSVPFVLCTYSNTLGTLDPASYSSVSIDDHATAMRATELLIESGHRRIAFLCDETQDGSISELRFRGYRDALQKHGLPLDESLIICTNTFTDLSTMYEAVMKRLSEGISFTGLFAISDMMALSAIRALTDSGLRVPEDCSVVGIDGLDLTAYTLPRLTTMVQPVEEMGKACADLIISLIEGTGENRQIIFEPVLRTGSSLREIRS